MSVTQPERKANGDNKKAIFSRPQMCNRLTYEIKLSAFTLGETEEYLQYLNVKLSKYDVVQAYMVTGGIPYYLSYFKKGNSLPQCVDDLFFSKNAKLRNEFDVKRRIVSGANSTIKSAVSPR